MRIILVVLCLILLAGCKITEYRTEYLPMEERWLVNCPTVEPPDKETYILATDRQRAVMMALAYTKQVENNTICNVRMEEARDYNTRMSTKRVE